MITNDPKGGGQTKLKGKGAFEVLRYEIDMHEALPGGRSDQAIKNAITESMVLHVRQLCEIFLSSSKENDNIKLEDIVPKHPQSEPLITLIAELRSTYGSRRKEESPCWVFNKMLVHPTTERLDRYNYEPALNCVRPILKKIIDHIESRVGRFERRLSG